MIGQDRRGFALNRDNWTPSTLRSTGLRPVPGSPSPGRGFGAFGAILDPRIERDVEVGLEAAYDWLLASSPVAGPA